MRRLATIAAWALTALGPCGAARAADAGSEFFEKKIRPVLVAQCYECHATGVKKLGGGLLLDSRAGVRRGGDSGPAIVPGDPDKSLLIQALRYGEDAVQMPPRGKLPAAVIADFETWVKLGAPDPREQAPAATAAAKSWDALVAERRVWWSLQPVQPVAVPATRAPDWSAQPIDRFLRATWEAQELAPAPAADARTLARRLSLVLTGLPPTEEQVAQFVAECGATTAGEPLPPAAVARYVDALLQSPHFGERWTRHWLDVVRFTETHGNEWNYEVHHAWRYRDYLIRAFNADLPYDQLVREHIAGDLLPQPRWNAAERFNESVIGTALYRFGEVNHDDCIGLRPLGYDLLDNQIDTLGKAFQALTLACARCHDHKLDAVSMRDYYGLLGVLRSARCVSHTLDAPDVNARVQEQLRALKPALRREAADVWLHDVQQMERYLRAAAAKKLSAPDAAEQAAGLDAARLDAWVAAVSDDKSPLEQPLTLWRRLFASLAKDGTPFGDAWKPLAEEYVREHEQRSQTLQAGYLLLADFRRGEWPDWQIAGQALRDQPTRSGDFAVAVSGDKALAAVLPAGAMTHALSDKLNGALRSPVLTTPRKHISFHVLGQNSAALRLVSNHCQLNYRNYRALTSAEPQWITFALPDDPASLRVYAELMTMFDNPKFPDQLGQLGGDKRDYRVPWNEAAANPRSFFGVTQVVVHDAGAPPPAELGHLRPLFDAPPASLADCAARWSARATAAVRAWQEDRATDDDVRWLDALLQRGLLTNKVDATSRLAELVAAYRQTEAELSPPRISPGLADFGPGFDQPVFPRGDCWRPGEAVPRQYVAILTPPGARPLSAAPGSGRLELAELLASPNNPLTARVMVNRVWHHLFGAGLVRTVDDFGHAGELPSHPELLDHLAAQFVADGWSIKRLVRRIVLSRTFQLSHTASAGAAARDPQNRWLTHYPARRMEAEAIRDSILAASGRLDRTLFGMSVPSYRETDDPYHRLFRGPLDGDGRRSLYIKFSLMESPAFLSAFNLPGGKVAQGRRDATNVPEQALALLNDPFVLQQAEEWNRRLLARPSDTVADRIEAMFQAALGRPPQSDERERFAAFVTELAALHQAPPSAVLTHPALWRDVAHAVFNLREFVTIP